MERANKARKFSLWGWFKSNFDQIFPYIMLLIVLIIIRIAQPTALSGNWIANKIEGTMILVFASMGQAFVSLLYGTDLSIAGMICLTNSLAAVIMPDSTIGIIGTVLLNMLIGVVGGSLNGLMITKLRMQPWIVTLGTWQIFDGIALLILRYDGGSPAWGFTSTIMHRWGKIPVSLIFIILLILMWQWIKRTRFGTALFAIGLDPSRAHYSGINVNRTILMVYAFSGLFAAIAGLYRTAYVNSGSPTAGDSYVLLTCCACVIGGVNASTGRGSLTGTIVGAFVLKLLTDTLLFLGLKAYWTSLIQGILLIVMVAFNQIIAIIKNKRIAEGREV